MEPNGARQIHFFNVCEGLSSKFIEKKLIYSFIPALKDEVI
jgi:hypothetical protein